eukprot:GHVU01139001.1.p2 GENE.GHVU01139001.1~~GHVU01139001.1.p2  ORF type:complete len:152 (+),score=6.59 GHVU01139001.1:1151-1606(+)
MFLSPSVLRCVCTPDWSFTPSVLAYSLMSSITSSPVPSSLPYGCICFIRVSTLHTGIVTRSGTFTYEAKSQTTEASLDQTAVVGIGVNPFDDTSVTDCFEQFTDDPDTEGVCLECESVGVDGCVPLDACVNVSALVDGTCPSVREWRHVRV